MKIKVAYICHYSNSLIHSILPLRLRLRDRLTLRIKHLPITTDVADFAVWNSNAIEEMTKFSDNVELHVIAPYHYLKPKTFEFCNENIYYHFFRSDNEFAEFVVRNTVKSLHLQYKSERKRIKGFLNQIGPDIVQIVGAENPYYSMSVFDIPKSIPVIVQLQTLMNDTGFGKIIKGYDNYRCQIEKRIIERADYIGTTVLHFRNIINGNLKTDAQFVDVVLPLSEPIVFYEGEKKYDFVYFAADISKAVDYAIEAFILASEKRPGITLDIIGGYTVELRNQIESQLDAHGLKNQVTFEGRLKTHDDVLSHIRLSRFALIPLKVDQVSGTIRESMANGLPVVTTVTPGTPKLNRKRQTILLSEKGDYQSMAENMCRLIDDDDLANRLQQNGLQYMSERSSNASLVKQWIDIYKSILSWPSE